MNSFLAFFAKYRVHLNVVFLIFWSYLLYYNVTSPDFKITKIILPIVFIGLTLFNIFAPQKKA